MKRRPSPLLHRIQTYRVLSLFALICLTTIFGCSVVALPVTGADRDAVLAFSEPKTENLLSGFNSGDYATFARDFDAAMRQAENESVFASTRTLVKNKIGAYVSRQVSSVIKQDQYFVVIYSARFEQEDNVTVRVVFHQDGDHQITGLWFDSPKLRQQ
jgi:hypothetical protein